MGYGRGEEAVERALELAPDVVLMDVKMPGRNGSTPPVRSLANPEVAVLMLTMHEDDDSVFAAMGAAPAATCSRAPTRTTCCARSVRSRPARLSSGRRSPSA